ncbi:MAG: hypothetical protein KJ970_15760 [Candidatus Eisenbacteria bacterium]|uniref:Uncharacterized protein n=1 Tax=Eiseniibacteriota bacterium TaxID=2212470 RepID=A0A948W7A1_UNCEI|nr:hypothetical protein [Candidatus Eisenbacteria bacterium]MBU1949114.1 hypothetical protein [Candidatus Eisenbacteria bacterium]MBU2692379.1 hypothetical protein [Candidatus Eisenbacteria bacterium]
MAKLLWAVPCQKIITDQQTNAVSHIEVVEAFLAPEFPITIIPMQISTLWLQEEINEILAMRLRMRNPQGKLILEFESPKQMKLTKKRHRVNVSFSNITLDIPGEYTLIIEQKKSGKWRKESTLPVDFNLMKSQKK